VSGVTVPKGIIKRLSDAPKKECRKVSVDIAGELIRKMKPCCQGAHLMTLGRDNCVPGIIEVAGLA